MSKRHVTIRSLTELQAGDLIQHPVIGGFLVTRGWQGEYEAQVRAETVSSILESPTHHIVSRSGTIWTRDRADADREGVTDLAGNLLASVQKVRADRVRAEAERTLPSEDAVVEAIRQQLALYTLPANYSASVVGEPHESVARRCAPLIGRDVLTLLASAPTVEKVRQDVAKALRAQRIVCPVHGIPDCSALLNGCTRPNLIRKTVEGCAQIAEQGASDA